MNVHYADELLANGEILLDHERGAWVNLHVQRMLPQIERQLRRIALKGR
jgi:hypothetical protein